MTYEKWKQELEFVFQKMINIVGTETVKQMVTWHKKPKQKEHKDDLVA